MHADFLIYATIEERGEIMTIINRSQSIYELIKEHPEIKYIMASLGFNDILKPGMLQSVGRVMTIDKGTRMKGIDIDHIIEVFKENGFQLT